MARRRRLGTVNTIARRTVLGGMAAVFLAACSAGSVPTEPPRPNLPPIAVPGDPGQPIGTRPAPGDPGIGGLPGSQPAIVIPKPGRLGVHPVGATSLEARVDGRRVRVTVSWWSGVAPCNVLDSVAQILDGANITIELREGADQLGVACIEIAMLKATVVDLGELLPGAYVISAGGDAAPIRVIVR
jgi:hypothetical protein